jgi:hypothetical protein
LKENFRKWFLLTVEQFMQFLIRTI